MGSSTVDVLHVTRATAGGVRRHLLDLIPGLAARGVRQALAYDATDADETFRAALPLLEAAGVVLLPVRMPRPIRLGADAQAALALNRAVRRLRPTILHLHASKAGAVGRAAAWLLPGVRTVYSPHAPARRLGAAYVWIERLFGWTRTDALIAVSREERNEHRALRLVPSRCHHLAPCGIDASFVRARAGVGASPRQGSYFVACGRLVAEKDPLLLVDAMARLLSTLGPEATPQLVWVGDGELRSVVEARVREAGLSAHWYVTGWLRDPSTVMRGALALVQSSCHEAFGYVTLEAMALARPVIATATAGSRDLVDHERTGLLVETGDAAALAHAMKTLLDDPVWAASLGTAGAARADHFSADRMIESTLRVYRCVAPRLTAFELTPLRASAGAARTARSRRDEARGATARARPLSPASDPTRPNRPSHVS